MGTQVIEQPDGLLAVFDHISDMIIMYDATPTEIIDWYVECAQRGAREEATRTVEQVAAGRARQAYGRRAMSWATALAADRKNHGEVWQVKQS